MRGKHSRATTGATPESRPNDVAATQAAQTWRPALSVLMVRCPKSGREFNSGYRTNGGDLAAVPPDYTIRIHCPLCKESHNVRLAEAREVTEGGDRSRQRG